MGSPHSHKMTAPSPLSPTAAVSGPVSPTRVCRDQAARPGPPPNMADRAQTAGNGGFLSTEAAGTPPGPADRAQRAGHRGFISMAVAKSPGPAESREPWRESRETWGVGLSHQ